MTTSMSEPIDLGRINRLHLTSAGRKLLETELEYSRGCVQLTAVVGCSLAQAQAVVTRIACENRVPLNKLPMHIYDLMLNTWRIENAPKSKQWGLRLEYPTECANGCLKKFYQYLEEESK